MSTARKPDLVWAILKGSIIGERTVADVCREHRVNRQTGHEIANRLRATLGLDNTGRATNSTDADLERETDNELDFPAKDED